MELLKEIASVSGKGGLFRILKPTRNGVILETIDEKKTKLVASSNERVSILKEISIYTTGTESSKPLEDVLKLVHSKFGDKLQVTTKSSDAELRGFIEKVVPDYDEEKVYCSDIKKLVSWYGILMQYFPEVFSEEKKAEKTEAKEEKKETPAVKETKTAATAEKKAAAKEETKEKPKAKAKAKEEVKEKPKTATKTASKSGKK